MILELIVIVTYIHDHLRPQSYPLLTLYLFFLRLASQVLNLY